MRKDKHLKQQFFIRWIFLFILLICLKVSVNAQDITVTGMVKTDKSGEPLTGVSVKIKGTVIGVSTDKNGYYSILTPRNGTLVVTHVGYETLETSVNSREKIDISLVSTSTLLEDVLLVGYGTQKKVNLTGAVDVISNKQIGNRLSPTVSQTLQGLSPGLTFSLGDNGFEPGASMDVKVRGLGSINGGSPYVLIDGFPGEMDRLNPNDIESISVLKDAAASAIYGARAPYGVILITTKSGKKNEKLSVAYSGNMSVNSPARLPKMLDSYTFARVINEFGVNGGGRTYSDAAIDRIIAYQDKDWDYLKQFYPADATYYESMPLANGTWGTNQFSHANYDWYDEFYGNSLNQQHNLSVNGGSNKITYYLSSGFIDQNSVIKYGTDNYKRFNLVGKVKVAITDWWDLRYETRFMKSTREFPSMPGVMNYGYMFWQVMRSVPTQAKYNGFGNYNIQSKIPFVEDGGTSDHTTTENWQVLATELRPLKGWKIYGEFAYQSTGIEESNRKMTIYTDLVDGSLSPFPGSIPSSIEQVRSGIAYWTTNIYSSYDISLGRHNMFLMAGTQLESFQSNELTASKTNLIVPTVPSLETANGSLIAGENLGHSSTQGYFGRLTYNFDEKYLLEANARYDGTSRFKQGNRWGFFPSFSAGWNLNREKFWKTIGDYVNVFKVRGSWGQLGNQQVAPYQDLALIPLHSGQLNWLFKYGTTRPLGYTSDPNLVSPDLTWEIATTKNIGLNMGFLNNKLQLDFDLFERVTENMIGPSNPVPGVLGAPVPNSNNATLRTRGWEGTIRWNQAIKNSGLSYFASFNLSDAQSVVLDYLNPTGIITGFYPGKKVGEIWGYTANELFKSQDEVDAYLSKVDLSYIYNKWNPGDLKYLDKNGDGKVNSGTNSINDPGDLSVIGNSTPRYQWGLSAGFEYKGFDFSFLIRGTAKRDFFVTENASVSNYAYWGIKTWLHTGLTTDHLDYFRDQAGDQYTGLYEGDANINLNAFWPKKYIQADQNYKNQHTSTRYLLDLSYVRLQNVQLGYSLSQAFLKKLRLQKIRIYISGENLWTMTSLIKNMDPTALGPDWLLSATYRADRMVSMGINIVL